MPDRSPERGPDLPGGDSEGPEPTAELFLRALELPAKEREAFLNRSCRDAEQVQAVERLLASDAKAPHGFLPACDLRHQMGTRVGAFELIEHVGEGGMGTVYRAMQDLPRREVALKLIRPERLGPEIVRRFTQEAQVLGTLQHPGITQIFGAGTARIRGRDGSEREEPYLAMEFLRGEPLFPYAESHGLGIRERLELLARIADALHHAHLRGVVHRDLKPENVLVVPAETATGDAAFASLGQPKVLDFGIARLMDGAASVTREGELVGTLTAMSPEQMEGSGKVDARTDVWALGVLAYRLLSGEPPHDLSGLSLPRALRRVRSERAQPIDRFDQRLRGDVATIVARALHPDQELRYPSAAAFSEDVRRHLRGAPIRARSHSRLYVLRRTLRHHRIGIVVAALLLACAGLYLAQRREANVLAEQSRRQLAQALDAIAEFQRFGRENLRQDPSQQELLRSVLTEQQKLLEGRRDLAPQSRYSIAEARVAVGILSHILGDPSGLTELDRSIEELAALADEVPEAETQLVNALNERATFACMDGEWDAAEVLLERCWNYDMPSAWKARTQNQLARVARARGDRSAALAGYRAAFEEANATVYEEDSRLEELRVLARLESGSSISALLADAGQVEEALALHQELIGDTNRKPAGYSVSLLTMRMAALTNQGILLGRSGAIEEAIEVLDRGRVLGEELLVRSPGHLVYGRDLAILLLNLGAHYAMRQDFDAARSVLERGLEIAAALVEAPTAALEIRALKELMLTNLAKIDIESEDHASALARLEHVGPALRAGHEATPGRHEFPLGLAEAGLNRGLCLVRTGRHREGVEALEGVDHDLVPSGGWKRLAVLSAAVEVARTDPELGEEDRRALVEGYVERAIGLAAGWLEAEPEADWSGLADEGLFGALNAEALYREFLELVLS